MNMGFAAECMACIVGKQLRALPEEWPDAQRSDYLRDVMRIILDADPGLPAPRVSWRLEALARERGVPRRDFRSIKRHWNRLMMDLAPQLRADIEAAPDPLARAMQYALTANYIDFGALAEVTESRLAALLEEAPENPHHAAEYAHFRRDLESAGSLAYVTDNCGKIVADMLLIEQLRRLRPALAVTVILRGQEVLNDATPEDARMVGLDAVATVLGNGNGMTGTFRDAMDPLSRSALEGADIVISKGQANFESLGGSGLNAYFLFLCKCDRFRRHFHMTRLQGVLANERRLHQNPEANA